MKVTFYGASYICRCGRVMRRQGIHPDTTLVCQNADCANVGRVYQEPVVDLIPKLNADDWKMPDPDTLLIREPAD